MKSFMLVVIMSLVTSCKTDRPESRDDKVVSLEITKVNFGIMTTGRIDCGDFEKTFANEMDRRKIQDGKIIEVFSGILKKLKVDNENYMPDVRAKVLIRFETGRVDTLCLSQLGIIRNGVSYLESNELNQFIKDVR